MCLCPFETCRVRRFLHCSVALGIQISIQLAFVSCCKAQSRHRQHALLQNVMLIPVPLRLACDVSWYLTQARLQHHCLH